MKKTPKGAVHPYFHPTSHPIERKTFVVTNPVVAQKLADWYRDCYDAHQEVAQYVRNMLGTRGTSFDYDLQSGRLTRMSFHGNRPKGWRTEGYGKPHLYLSDPSAIAHLPTLPSRKKMHDLLDWPTFNERDFPVDLQDVARFANLQLTLEGTNAGETLVHVPLSQNFEKCLRIAQMIDNWFELKTPDFLVPIEEYQALESYVDNTLDPSG